MFDGRQTVIKHHILHTANCPLLTYYRILSGVSISRYFIASFTHRIELI